jgi:hypothetical protein
LSLDSRNTYILKRMKYIYKMLVARSQSPPTIFRFLTTLISLTPTRVEGNDDIACVTTKKIAHPTVFIICVLSWICDKYGYFCTYDILIYKVYIYMYTHKMLVARSQSLLTISCFLTTLISLTPTWVEGNGNVMFFTAKKNFAHPTDFIVSVLSWICYKYGYFCKDDILLYCSKSCKNLVTF